MAPDSAASIYRLYGERHQEGRTLQQLALAVGWDDPAKGTRLAERALGLIEPEREPRLELASRHALIWFLNDLPSLVGEEVLAEGNDVKILDRDT